ncbi:DUF2231 domain-containing protein [Kribbella amoyensis]|uniref:DUF2231 domain-containing protein n=1 Tax=Kribbella amoyensis TaxID=996641 RepID=UPI002353FD47|nr:DUF2231 domain-containing protein [Kribbella amoyensis]
MRTPVSAGSFPPGPRDRTDRRLGRGGLPNLAVVALFVVSFVVRASQGYEEASVAGFVLSLIALAILGISGWLGGKLAYRYGVRVADEQAQREGFTH